jgi:tetratricopeptide (TPR) repeat protein
VRPTRLLSSTPLFPSSFVRISACLIVRDEQSFLDDCLRSLEGNVDEIVIVDTGSVDDTPAIARSRGARVISYTWRDDFAAARNYGLEAATGAWILYIDADERLVDTSRESLRLGLNNELVYAARLRFRPTVNGTLAREYRLFRNDPRLRFKGAMHETIRPDLDALERTVGAKTIDSPATMVHLGYEGDLTAKHLRNVPLLRAAIKANPDRLYFWNHLAETLGALGDIQEAIVTADAGLARSKHRSDRSSLRMRAALAATSARFRLAAGGEALPMTEMGLELQPENPWLIFLKAKALVEAGRPDEAIAIAQQLLAIDGETYCDPDTSYDRRIFGTYAHDLMGVALLRMGRKNEAACAFARAAKASPDDPSYSVKALALGGQLI